MGMNEPAKKNVLDCHLRDGSNIFRAKLRIIVLKKHPETSGVLLKKVLLENTLTVISQDQPGK